MLPVKAACCLLGVEETGAVSVAQVLRVRLLTAVWGRLVGVVGIGFLKYGEESSLGLASAS